MFPTVSIIIPVKSNNRNLEESITHCLKLDYPFFEIIVLPDEMMGAYTDRAVKVIPTGACLPAAKRDIGSNNASGEILAFLDDDTYPVVDWLKQGVLHFQNKEISCVCGPAVTPENEPLRRKASGKILESIVMSGPARFRYVALKSRYTNDFPSCNFLIRKSDFVKIGGFQTKFWPGEDTILCDDVINTLKKKIFYDPLVKVFHHRRSVYGPHLKQIKSYALHRGYFAKCFKKSSLRIGYFLPSLLIFVLFTSFVGAFVNTKSLTIPVSYLLLVALFSLSSNIRLFWYVFSGIVASHLIYGVFFINGLFSKKLKEE
jgi:glycosyltransferase involved in cell wall biosynthesis